jgi:diguanylate cyclase (GGDEF)-like protein
MLYIESRRLGRSTVFGFLCLAIVILVQAVFGGWGLYRLHDELSSGLVSLSDTQVEALELKSRLVTLRKLEKDILLGSQSPRELETANLRWQGELKDIYTQFSRLEEALAESGLSAETSVDRLKSSLAQYVAGIQKTTHDLTQGRGLTLDQAVAAVAMYKISIEDMQQAINQLVVVAEDNEQQVLQRLAVRRDMLLLTLGAISLLSLLAGTALSLSVTRKSVKISRTLEHQALHDALTGLLNRRGFSAWLEAHSARGGALAYLDLDRFKLINDLCGHPVGDDLLVKLTAKLVARCEQLDCVIARIGGDEFAVWIADVDDLVRARHIAHELVALVEAHVFEWMGQPMELGASVGLALGKPGFVYAEVVSRADAACRLAKTPGSAKVLVYEESDPALVEARREERWAAKLPQLIQEGRFCLFGQRIVPLQPGAGPGHVEVLLRGLDEDGKFIAPGLFLPAAERFGLMPKIDRWVIETLLSSELEENGHYAVNLSGQTLADKAYLPTLEALLRASGKAHLLSFEITESAAMTSIDTAREYIHRLKALGCQLALDDFGSGFSSFAYLRDLQVDYLKIDGSLIRVLGRRESDAALVQAIVQMAQALGLKTIAEFVETPALADMLRDMKVDFGQGYGLHKPEPLKTLHSLS